MDFDALVEGPLLWTASIVFVFGIIARIVFFLIVSVKRNHKKHFRFKSYIPAFIRILVPYYMVFLKRPFFTASRYFQHFCIIAVPIWFSGHIRLWEESSFDWYWVPMPDELADFLTLALLGLAAYLFVRRLASPHIRRGSSLFDYILIIVTALPFMTGYFLFHGTFNAISFLDDNLLMFHVLSSEIMLVLTVFLFCRTRLDERSCTGCSACELNCPTGALFSTNAGKVRVFEYLSYSCICCGACIRSCPEEAAGLRHEITVTKFFNIFSPDMIRSVELETCRRCGVNFAPIPQLNRIAQEISEDYLFLCLPCRKLSLSAALYNLDSSNKHPVRK